MAAWVAASRLDAELEGYVRELGSGVILFPGGNLSNNYCRPSVRLPACHRTHRRDFLQLVYLVFR